ncbi:MAG: Ig-like domain-containing protein [Cytophagaceae bacterium]|jgi:hypothetical protein|nr:Ig-like domain-containing protein [Cytophagaceae bacterium]
MKTLRVVLMVMIAFEMFSCKKKEREEVVQPAGNTKPTISLVEPESHNITTNSYLMTFEASASVESGSVTKVAFFLNNLRIGEDATSPYTYTYSVPLGNYTLFARSYANGDSTQSDTLVFDIYNCQACR